MAHHKLLPRQYLILGLVSLCAPLGDTCLSRGMTTCRPSRWPIPARSSPRSSLPGSPGIALLIGFFASYLTALSWADLTFVLPATAFGNVIVALLSPASGCMSPSRWSAGRESCSSPLGVGFVAQGPSLTERPVRNRGPRRTAVAIGGAAAMTIPALRSP
jgi:hypothetical protein